MIMKCTHIAIGAILVLTLSGPKSSAQSRSADYEDETFEVGVRLGISAADGEPANDIPWGGLYGRYRLNESWLVVLSLD